MNQGEIVVTSQHTSLITVVGRNVAACIRSSSSAVCGMTNFSRPAIYEARNATAQYGNVALPKLIKMIRDHDNKSRFEVHLFGGGSHDGNDHIGMRNIEMARKICAHFRIDVLSEDTGGSMGKKVMYDTASGHIAVLKVYDIRKEDWGE